MAGGGGGADGGESRRRERRAELEVAIMGSLTLQVYIGMAVTVMTHLAFTWSTVVLTGGYVSSLQKKDFQCLTVITAIEATSIFHMESHGRLNLGIRNIMRGTLSTGGGVLQPLVSRISASMRRGSSSSDWGAAAIALPFAVVLAALVLAMLSVLVLFYTCGPYICIGLASWRLSHRDYHGDAAANGDGEASLANLTPALDFFYTLALCQGVLFHLLIWLVNYDDGDILSFHKQNLFPREWCKRSVAAYIRDTRERCERDPGLSEARSLLTYAIGLLDSESQEEYLSGARILDMLIKDGEDASSIVLGSRSKVQRLLDTLGWRRSTTSESGGHNDEDAEIRVLAVRIVADLAGGVRLSQFPGAIQSVSTLLETTGQPYCNNGSLDEISPSAQRKYNQERARRRRRHGGTETEDLFTQRLNLLLKRMISILMETKSRTPEARLREYIADRISRKKPGTGAQGAGGDHDHVHVQQNKIDAAVDRGGSWNELILQGLRILEGLACDAHNCMEICSDLGLIAKITAPLYSGTLIQDIGSSEPWADIANASLKVVHQLIRATAPRTILRHEISSNEQAMSNLESILHRRSEAAEAVGVELQMRAMEILTQLVLHSSSVNVTSETREQLVRKQLEIFLPHGDGEVTADNKTKRTLRATAGETLISVLSRREALSVLIIREHHDIIDRLTGMLDGKYNIRHKTLSANILEKLCTHCNEHVKETLLRKVLTKILKEPTTEASESTTSAPGGNGEIQKNYSQGGDLEMKFPKKNDRKAHGKASHGKKEDQQANVSSKKEDQQTNDNSKKEDHQASEDEANMKELQEALLSLNLMLREQLFGAESSTPMIQENDQDGELVLNLKAIVDENCQETPIAMKIVKLCGQIAALIIRKNSCTDEKRKQFVESLSKASKTMASLESCMLFSESDCDLQKTARPLLSDLEKELKG